MGTTLDAESSLGTLVLTGCLLGFIHVLSGPDHLSALASLSVNGSFQSFCLGVQWGFGHSTGLILTALLFSTGWIDLGAFAKYGEPVVGVFMIVLGVYGFTRAESGRSGYSHHAASGHSHGVKGCWWRRRSWGKRSAVMQEMEMRDLDGEGLEEEVLLAGEDQRGGERVREEGQEVMRSEDNPLKEYKRIAALCVGIVHGVAGPGGVLGVMPAVVLNDRVKSSVYIMSFCVASIVTMGVFAGCYGEATSRVGEAFNLSKCLVYTSSSFAVIVGVVWLILLYFGKLEEVFP